MTYLVTSSLQSKVGLVCGASSRPGWSDPPGHVDQDDQGHVGLAGDAAREQRQAALHEDHPQGTHHLLRLPLCDCLHDFWPVLLRLLPTQVGSNWFSVYVRSIFRSRIDKLFEKQAKVTQMRDFWVFVEGDLMSGLYWEKLYNKGRKVTEFYRHYHDYYRDHHDDHRHPQGDRVPVPVHRLESSMRRAALPLPCRSNGQEHDVREPDAWGAEDAPDPGDRDLLSWRHEPGLLKCYSQVLLTLWTSRWGRRQGGLYSWA